MQRAGAGPLNLLYVVQDPGIRPGSQKGAWVHVQELQRALASQGARVRGLYPASESEAQEALAGEEALGADLVYERYSLGSYAASEWAWQRGLPHVLEVNSPLVEEARRYRPEQVWSEDAERNRQLFERARLVLCVSELVADYAMRQGARPAQIWVAPNGVDVDRFRPRPAAGAERPRRFPNLTDPVVLGFHGRLRPWHGFDRIVSAAAEAIARGSNLALHCVGSGPYRESLENALGGDRWHVTDWCSGEELAEHVAGFDILALGYDPGEACYFSPLKLREGMAAGAVPVVPDLGSLADDVQQGRAGLIYDPADPTALRQAIERLAGDAPLRAKLAAAAREAAHRHSWAAIAREVLRRSLGVPQ
ncbi:MAG: glycosyltransferase family 4 protein [Planctomycetota bacterium]